jgi:pimeloyl-ACP methyl ester carboxylesterase
MGWLKLKKGEGMKLPRLLQSILTGVTAAGLLIATAGTAQAAGTLPTTAPPPPPLNWQPCPDSPPMRECATLVVPLDYADLSKGTIELPVTRALATGQSMGPLVYNPGGPALAAGSRLRFSDQARLERLLTPEIVQRFDIVAFNPRGTTDGILCFNSETQKTYWQTTHLPKTTAEYNTLLNLERQANQRCLNDNAPLVRHLDSASGVRDMEQLRRALGVSQISFIGFSYGTFFGTRYATLYPGRVKAMVLDAVTDRSISDPESFADLIQGYEASWTDFKQWCQNAANNCRLRGQNIDAVFEQVLATARATGIPAPFNPIEPERPVSDWELTFAVQATLLPGDITFNWTEEVIVKATENDASLAGLLYDSSTGARGDGTYNPGGTFRAITCLDTRWSQLLPNLTAVQVGAFAARTLSPKLGEAGFFQAPAQCHGYPIAPVEAPPVNSRVPAGQPAFVVVGSTLDRSTPYKWARHIAQQIPGSRLVTRDGYGHVSMDKSRCIKTIITDYLIRGTLPANNTHCPTDPDLYPPQPVPNLGASGTLTTLSDEAADRLQLIGF